MLKKTVTLNLIFILIISFSLNAWNTTVQDQMIQDLDIVKYHILIKYGPTQWKLEHLGWTLEKAYSDAKMRILNEHPTTSQDYQKILTQFLASMRDYHVHVRYYSTAWSFFPMRIKRVDHRYYLEEWEEDLALSQEELQFFNANSTDTDRISKNMIEVFKGDELIEFDGKPIQEVIEQLIDENFNGDRSLTGYELAIRNLFIRKASLGHETPQGIFSLTFKSQATGQEVECKLPWLHMPELIFNHDIKERYLLLSKKNKECLKTPLQQVDDLLTKDFSVAIAQELLLQPVLNRTKFKRATDEREKSFLPKLGRTLWESSKNQELYAYLYQHPLLNQPVGYIYLPSFSKAGKDADEYLEEIVNALSLFDNRAKALVVDITDNTGGNMMFMYALLSLLTNKPLKVPYHHEVLVQEDIQKAVKLYKIFQARAPLKDDDELTQTLSGYVFTNKVKEQIVAYASTILQTWEAGEVFTPPVYLFGIDEIAPHPLFEFEDRPIIVLVNSFCFSCGDFFPAILQDNKQAVIFGEKTAGAGGYVKPYTHTSRFGVASYSLTSSIAYRLNGQPIENLGVTPDIPYSIDLQDIRENYCNYIMQVNLEIKKIIESQF